MSLPWFAFHLDAYTGDTMHLTTEEHGAYLLLMIAYYRTEKPLPGYDRALASICKLSLDRWQIAKVALEPFFRVADGLWHHDRIEAEMRAASEKHAARTAQRTAASAARWGKNASRTTTAMRPASEPNSETEKSSEPQSRRNAARIRAASEPVCGSDATITITDRGGGVETRARDPGGSDDVLPSLFEVRKIKIRDDQHQPLFADFAAFHTDQGTMSSDWQGLWDRHVERMTAPPVAKKPKAKPRVEVNKRPDTEPLRAAKSMISEDAYALAAEVAAVMKLPEGHPSSVGAPMLMQAWLSSWPADLILETVKQVMARRSEPPGTMKYFENAIARAHADIQRPMPIASPPQQETLTHEPRRRAARQSLPDAARDLAAEFAALTGGGTIDGAGESGNPVGAIPHLGGD